MCYYIWFFTKLNLHCREYLTHWNIITSIIDAIYISTYLIEVSTIFFLISIFSIPIYKSVVVIVVAYVYQYGKLWAINIYFMGWYLIMGKYIVNLIIPMKPILFRVSVLTKKYFFKSSPHEWVEVEGNK